MKKLYPIFILLCSTALFTSALQAQEELTIDFTNMNPHIGQTLYIRVVDKSDSSEIARTTEDISTADFSVSLNGLIPDSSYNIDFYADHNKNRKYDAPPADHAWRLSLDAVDGDNTLSFVHNTTFTDIKWPHRLTLAFSNMTPHVGQNLYLALKNSQTSGEIERKKMQVVAPFFDVPFDSIQPDGSYTVDFFADYNQNDNYDAPPVDHTWQITVNNVKGDTIVPFVHNTNFTDIHWQFKLTFNLFRMTPHLNQALKLYLRRHEDDAFIDTVEVNPVTHADFSVNFYTIVPDSSYHIDFYADHNNNGSYDVPPADHAWRIHLLEIKGDTVVDFIHNTTFTDIELGSPTVTDDVTLKGFSVYPNPAADFLIIKPSKISNSNLQIRIYNTTGMLVQQLITGTYEEIKINVSSLNPGLYILDIGEGQNRKQLKFTKE